MTSNNSGDSQVNPFDFYLADPIPPPQRSSSSSGQANNDARRQQPLQLHLPSLMPTLAHGGGGEVLPLSMFASPFNLPAPGRSSGSQQYGGDASKDNMTVGDAWLMNNGFGGMGFLGQPGHMSPLNTFPPQPASVPAGLQYPSQDGTRPSSPRSPATTIFPPPPQSGRSSACQSPVAFAPPTPIVQPTVFPIYGSNQIPASFPMYSSSGLDLMGLLARVSTRPNKVIDLGPVDDSCSFVVTDVRRYDCPIIYCSQNFCDLSGYASNEVIGRNCRFMQAPPGVGVTKGSARGDSEAEIRQLAKSLGNNKEVQVKLVNYRKDGTRFTNLLTVIPIAGGAPDAPDDQVCFHIGFQIDLDLLNESILNGVQHGRWVGTNVVQPFTALAAPTHPPPTAAEVVHGRPPKTVQIPPQAIHEELRRDHGWLRAILDPSSATPSGADSSADTNDNLETLIDKVLLEKGPDLVWVISLKGTFLYVSPSVRRVMGYEPEELQGKGLGDICHPKDLVPVLRELKESCAVNENTGAQEDGTSTVEAQREPRVVDLMFRALTKSNKYIWIHSRGRLHIEPGKGRKAIILSARAREMGSLTVPSSSLHDPGVAQFWGTMSDAGTVLHTGEEIKEVLGVESSEVIGKRVSGLGGFVCGGYEQLDRAISGVVDAMRIARSSTNTNTSLEPAHVAVQLLPRHASSSSSSSSPVQATLSLYPVRSSCPTKIETVGNIVPAEDAMDVEPQSATSLTFDMSRRRTSTADLPSGIVQGGEEGTSVAYETGNVVSPPHIMFRVSLAAPPSLAPVTGGGEQRQVDMLEELNVNRNSSWQYELQQLKFGNDRLKEEIRQLEKIAGEQPQQLGHREQQSQPAASGSATASDTFWGYYPTSFGGVGAYGSSVPSPAADYGYGVPSGSSSRVPPTPTSATSLKRSRDTMEAGAD